MINRGLRSLRLAAFAATLILATLASAQTGTPAAATLQIDEIMSHAAAEGFSGSVLVARDGRILYQNAFGYANLEWTIPNDLQTKFKIGSMTKQFTALLALQFVNEGRIKLDGHVSDYLPYYRRDTGDRVTVRQLLSHTSGIPNFISAAGFPIAQPVEQRTSSKTLPRRIAVGIWNLNPEHSSITATQATSCWVQFLSRFPAFRMDYS
jgi:CubicO group peptidase (beta-lactamase class C family)